MHDNGKQFTSTIFKRFLDHNNIKDKPIPKSYPQLQGKVEAYNKIVKNEFISGEDISSIDEGKISTISLSKHTTTEGNMGV